MDLYMVAECDCLHVDWPSGDGGAELVGGSPWADIAVAGMGFDGGCSVPLAGSLPVSTPGMKGTTSWVQDLLPLNTLGPPRTWGPRVCMEHTSECTAFILVYL
ncbi:hypothetical protein GOODEAATRI_034223 [Goodea atripinnis]|uniref:Uncharacterized protein n=1 Tax=Goodea atripinnis TaxID=208336 RepID=A0ABV0N6H7_9TELE